MPNDPQQQQPRPLSPPPPIRRAPTKRIVIAGSGVLLAGLILIVAVNIDFGKDKEKQEVDPIEIVDIRPDFKVLDQQALRDLRAGNLGQPRNISVKLPRGSWIQKVDIQTGKLAQQYRFQDWDPNPEGKPDGWIRMQQPEAEVYLSDNRILTLKGDSALAFAPNRKLESGTLSGNVTIQLFTPKEDGLLPDPNTDTPSLIIHTEDAEFDNFIGEINCVGAVQIESPTMSLPNGSDLRILIDDQNETIKLTMRRPGQIRIAAASNTNKNPIVQQPIAQALPNTTTRSPASENTDSISKPKQVAANVTFYRLTLSENVRIHQGNRTALGDELSMIFSSKSKGVSDMLSSNLPASGRSNHLLPRRAFIEQPMLPFGALATLSFGVTPVQETIAEKSLGLAPPRSIDDLIIDCDGPLTIEPVTIESEKLESPEDALLMLTALGKPVFLSDTSEDIEAQCDHLLYHSKNQKLELVGTDVHQLWIRTPQLLTSGKKFWFEPQTNRAGFTGSGFIRLNRLQSPEAVTFIGPQSAVLAMAALGFNAALNTNNQETHALNVTWQDNMELQFVSSGDENQTKRLRKASFNGDVDVRSETFNLTSQTLLVGFTNDELTNENHIQSISATGQVHAISNSDEPGEIECDLFDLTLMQAANGKTIPLHFVATGDVKTSDPQQTLWSNQVNVSFREIIVTETDSQARVFQITDMLAEDDIEIRMATGARILANTIQSNGFTQTAVISSDDLKMVDGNLILSGGNELQLDGKSGLGKQSGPGLLRVFPENIPLEFADNGRTTKVLDDFAEPELRLTWQGAATFEESHENGNGAIEFLTEVRAVADPNKFEHDELESDDLRIEFVRNTANGQEGRRAIGKMIANGNAKLENRAWELEDHSDSPRIFYIECNYLEYDNATGEALADGKGTMLIRDERPQTQPDDEDEDSTNRFGASGTTSFRWEQQMQMLRVGDDLFDISMQDSVEIRHLNIKGEKATMSANQLIATIYRPRKASNADDGNIGLDMGGPAELMRVQAIGRVFLRTATRDVECEHFDYDVKTGIAILKAKPGNRVSVLMRGSVQPFKAEQIIWDMKKDTLRVVRATGGGGR